MSNLVRVLLTGGMLVGASISSGAFAAEGKHPFESMMGNPNNYECIRRGSNYCLRDLRTGQCTLNFDEDDYSDPRAACERYRRNM